MDDGPDFFFFGLSDKTRLGEVLEMSQKPEIEKAVYNVYKEVNTAYAATGKFRR